MTTKTQSALILVGTLINCIFIGFLASGVLREKIDNKFDSMRRQQRFLRVMEEIIQPTAQQKETITRMLTKRYKQLATIHEKHQSEIFAIYDSLQMDLSSVLSNEQLANLENQMSKGLNRFLRTSIDRMTRELQLDETQRKQVREIMSVMEEQFRANRQKYKGNWKEHRQVMMKQREKMQSEIETVLTL